MKKFVRTRAGPPPVAPAHPPQHLAPTQHPAHPAPQHLGVGVRANGHAAPSHKTNGHANGVPRRDDQHSTLSRYWSGAGGGSLSEGGGSGGDGARAPWEDPDFPPGWRAIGDKKYGGSDIVWMRPHELSARPLFLDEDGGDPDDISSAEFDARWCITVPTDGPGDGHVAAAASALALCPRLLRRALRPRAQGFRHDLYTGAFSFMFWEWGAWRAVTVDDRLPTRRGRLLSAHGAAPHDYTLPLLEKAYAKLYGSYVSLRAGSLARALQDLSGGVVQCLPLAATSPPAGAAAPAAAPASAAAAAAAERWRRALRVLNSAVPRSTLLVATVHPGRGGWRRLRSGLVAGQAYALTGLARVRTETAAETGVLVRARGTGGRGAAGGAWARGGSQWRALTDRDRDLLASRERHQAEFWMSFSEFVSSFSSLALVHVGPDDWLLEPALRARRPWRAVLARRRWRAGYNAGGAPHCTETTSSNPQFHVCIPGVAGGAATAEDDACHVVVSVTQQYRAGAAAGAALHDVGFAVYEVPRAAPRTAPIALHEHRPLELAGGAGCREVASLLLLPPGDYVVAPHTRRAHTDAGFLLRVFTDRQTNIWEVNEDNVIIRDIAAEFLDERNLITGDMPSTLKKWFGKQDIEEVDVSGVERVLRLHSRRLLLGGCGGGAGGSARELAGALLALAERRGAGGGRLLPVTALPALLALLQYWQHMFVKFGGVQWGGVCGSGAASASCYRLRALLWACGLSCSNKVLECVVARYSDWRRARLSLPSLCCALARLHLAHERYRNLDTKLKSNPLSLEEMILMTIYS